MPPLPAIPRLTCQHQDTRGTKENRFLPKTIREKVLGSYKIDLLHRLIRSLDKLRQQATALDVLSTSVELALPLGQDFEEAFRADGYVEGLESPLSLGRGGQKNTELL
jgi:hypothetical protein